MTSQQKQLDFLQILARPLMYKYPEFNKPNYASQPYCDRCASNLSNYFSSKATPNTDLCPACYTFLKNDDTSIVISGPTSIVHHTPVPIGPGGIGGPSVCPQMQSGMRDIRLNAFSANDLDDQPSSGQK